MKKLKIFFSLLLVAAIGLFVYQNWAMLSGAQLIRYNLMFIDMETRQPVIIYYLSVFLFGCLLSYIYTLPGKYRMRKNISEMREELEALRGRLHSVDGKNSITGQENVEDNQ